MSGSVAQARQNGCLALSRSVLAVKTALWPESGPNLAHSGHKFSYGWLCSNRLTLNLSKTKYLVFQPRQKVNSNLHPPLKIADQYLEQSYNIKYLGLVLDCFLSWHDHIDHISGKISKSVNIIAKLKRHVTKQSLISIYYTLVYPYLNYGCILPGGNLVRSYKIL